jgi:hypothetical protein
MECESSDPRQERLDTLVTQLEQAYAARDKLWTDFEATLNATGKCSSRDLAQSFV